MTDIFNKIKVLSVKMDQELDIYPCDIYKMVLIIKNILESL